MVTVSTQVSHAEVKARVARDGLDIMGGVHEGEATILLLGPGADFWPLFRDSPEMEDGTPDPVNRWSTRVVGAIAHALNAEALFPFGGPPYEPFLSWALASGRAWSSPVGMLVHDTAGMMVSFRGALRLPGHMALPDVPSESPCTTCAGQPCTTACPVDALSGSHFYDVAACHAYLDTPAGQDCMTGGCIARRACPISQRFNRAPEQSALHMRSFHRT